MTDVSRIVCLVDPSQDGRSAVAGASFFARVNHAELFLLHVPKGNDETPHPGMGSLGGLGDGVSIHLVTEQGPPGATIAAFARKCRADLIVISARRATSARWPRRSSMAGGLARSAACPVLVIPAQSPGRDIPGSAPFRDVVCAVDFTTSSDAARRFATGLAALGGARLTLIHAMTGWPERIMLSGREGVRMLDTFRGRVTADRQRLLNLVSVREVEASRVEALVKLDAPHRAILRAASETRADLVVMGVSSRGPLTEALTRSTSRAVLDRATWPVLLVPPPSTSEDEEACGRASMLLSATPPTAPDDSQTLAILIALGFGTFEGWSAPGRAGSREPKP